MIEELTKKEVSVVIERVSHLESNRLSITDIRAELDRLEALGANFIDFDTTYDYGETYQYIRAFQIRPETDEEFELRKKAILERREFERQNDLKRLAELKAKYEANNDKNEAIENIKSKIDRNDDYGICLSKCMFYDRMVGECILTNEKLIDNDGGDYMCTETCEALFKED